MKEQSEKTIIGFKGFNDKLQCTPGGKVFQYEVGKEYREEAAVRCQTGFHFCEHPLDVFGYYAPNNSRFAVVEASGIISGENGGSDTKRCSTRLKIVSELDICDLIRAAIKFTFDRCGTTETGLATGYRGAASATGYQGAASATGDRGAASATGYQSIACAHGVYGKAKASLGNWIVCSEWETKEEKWSRKNVKAGLIDGETLKPDTYYVLRDGKFTQAED